MRDGAECRNEKRRNKPEELENAVELSYLFRNSKNRFHSFGVLACQQVFQKIQIVVVVFKCVQAKIAFPQSFECLVDGYSLVYRRHSVIFSGKNMDGQIKLRKNLLCGLQKKMLFEPSRCQADLMIPFQPFIVIPFYGIQHIVQMVDRQVPRIRNGNGAVFVQIKGGKGGVPEYLLSHMIPILVKIRFRNVAFSGIIKQSSVLYQERISG